MSHNLKIVKVEESFTDFISSRVDEQIHRMLLQDENFLKAEKRYDDIIAEKITPIVFENYQNAKNEYDSIQLQFYYLQGIKDGMKLKDILG